MFNLFPKNQNSGVSLQYDFQTILLRLQATYEAQGWSRQLWLGDKAILQRVGVHPELAALADLERVIGQGKTQGTRSNYTARIKSLYATMRRLELIQSRIDEKLPTIRKPHAIPKPLTEHEAMLCMKQAEQPYRDWFTLGCRAGLRAAETNNIKGTDLTAIGDNKYELRVLGKGGTDITIPAHPSVVEIFERYNTQGFFWKLSTSRKLSTAAGIEMRRLGVSESRARFHACRHYFATSILQASGWDLLTTSKLMRHSSVATTQGYAQLRNDRPREVLGLL